MKVLLTGASGFVGSWVLHTLLAEGRHQVVITLRPGSDAWRIRHLLPQVSVEPVALDDSPAVSALLARQRPQAVLHLAWGGVAGAQRNYPAQWRNLSDALHLLEAAAAAGAQHWIGLGSQAEYGPCSQLIDEDTPTRPTTLYGSAKLATAQLALATGAVLGLRCAWLRLFSSYGPKDHGHWMIPSLIGALLRGERPAVTLGEQRWDYIHVRDVARAITAVLDAPEARGIFNLGSGQALPLRQTIEALRDRVAPGAPIGFGEVPYRADQVMHLQADIRRLQQATGWSPRVGLAEGMDETVAWYRDNPPQP